MGKLQRAVLGISVRETRCENRGFQAEPAARERLESAGAAFVAGYNLALEDGAPEPLAAHLGTVALELRGFAYEGAGMALQLLALLAPWRSSRWMDFVRGPGAAHVYMMHVGAGWALARLGRGFERPTARMDPLLRWLVMDGWGFHDGYFHPQRTIDRQQMSGRIPAGYARQAHDQGLGRALWFARGADPSRVASTVGAFSPERRAKLWSGVGLAAAYAGGIDRSGLEILRSAAGEHAPAMAQGAAFAAQARCRAGNAAAHTDLACTVLCGMTATDAAGCTNEALAGLPADGAVPAYEVWRERLRRQFESQAVAS